MYVCMIDKMNIILMIYKIIFLHTLEMINKTIFIK